MARTDRLDREVYERTAKTLRDACDYPDDTEIRHVIMADAEMTLGDLRHLANVLSVKIAESPQSGRRGK